ncbi:MAG TPA: sigma factor-like helix-turn-helix DNA-binding protein [Acidimicrobiia bacterium]|jgi:RNA polymerase sigma-70 factor (ECF subfamily)
MDPDDLVQEAFVRMLQRGLAGIDDPVAYMRRTMLNVASNERRRTRSTERVRRRVGAPLPSNDVYPSDVADLMELPPVTRALLYLTEIEGAPIAEAAGHLGMSGTAARTRLSRARRRLRSSLEEQADERLA